MGQFVRIPRLHKNRAQEINFVIAFISSTDFRRDRTECISAIGTRIKRQYAENIRVKSINKTNEEMQKLIKQICVCVCVSAGRSMSTTVVETASFWIWVEMGERALVVEPDHTKCVLTVVATFFWSENVALARTEWVSMVLSKSESARQKI